MKCPKCQAEMVEIRQDSVYIDVCKECRGVFLDAGELEELLRDTNSTYKDSYYEEKYHDEKRSYGEHHYDKHKDHKHKKKSTMKSILGDLFDF